MMPLWDGKIPDDPLREMVTFGAGLMLGGAYLSAEKFFLLPEPGEVDPHSHGVPILFDGEYDDGSGPLVAAIRFGGCV